MKHPFYAQLHMHTFETSACGVSTGAEMAAAAHKAGYSLIVITDHFMNANIGCSRRLRWHEKVKYLFRGYRAARAVGDKLGLTVLKGWETCNGGPEYLTYGLDEEFLLDNPDIAEVDAPTYLARVRSAGAFVTHAHPYREAFYIPFFVPDHKNVDAYEVYNGCHLNPAFDEKALAEARKHHLIELAGSDAHDTRILNRGAVALPFPCHDTDELILALRSRECTWMERI